MSNLRIAHTHLENAQAIFRALKQSEYDGNHRLINELHTLGISDVHFNLVRLCNVIKGLEVVMGRKKVSE